MTIQSPPPPPAPPLTELAQVIVDGKPMVSPQAIHRGMLNQRKALGEQMETLREERGEVSRQLQSEEPLDKVNELGLQKRLTTIDERIEALDKQIAVADAQVASTAAVPGAVVEPPPYVRDGPPEEVFILGGIFMFVAIMPISIAYARRIWRRSAKAVAALPGDILDRFAQIDQAVESVAVEVERIGEGQRFITRVLSEQGGRGAIGEGAARPIDVRAREAAEARQQGR